MNKLSYAFDMFMTILIHGGNMVIDFILSPLYAIEDWWKNKLEEAYMRGHRVGYAKGKGDGWVDAYSIGRESAERNGGML